MSEGILGGANNFRRCLDSDRCRVGKKESYMADLRTFFRSLEERHPRNASNIAGYIDRDGVFQWHVSGHDNLPAAVTVFDVVGKRTTGVVYTNLRKNHWLYTYTSGEGGNDLVYIDDKSASADAERIIGGVGNGKVRVLADDGPGPGPLRAPGGLYQAAKSLHDSQAPVKYEGENHTRDKGLHRALRYYMLAAYALLGKCRATEETDVWNYIAALLVDDEGRILSYGVNSGWFHHGETNMLLNYFRAHSNVATFPANTIVFSTLTPCKQCSTYLQGARPANSVIFIGQEDSGARGREGEKFGVHLSAVTDPIRYRTVTETWNNVVIGRKPPVGWAKVGEPITEKRRGEDKVEKHPLEEHLSKQMKEGASVADQIGRECQDILTHARGTFEYKSGKRRNNDGGEQSVKAQVLEYLNTWIASVNPQSSLRQVV